jgi:adenosylcobinamide-GDP ribazoletransferase
VLTQIRLAASFLTIIPLPIPVASEYDLSASMAWFPLVGLMMGAVFAIEDYALSFLLGHAIRSTLIVLSIAALSGALHLDGLADTADALGAGRDRIRALEILRDSRIGTFGAIAIFFALALKIVSLASLAGQLRIAALIIAPTISRWSMVAVSYKLEYLRAEGAGTSMLGRDSTRNLRIASVIAIIAMLPFFSRKVILAYVFGFTATLAMRSFYARWLGGVTGDLIGACGEVVEIIAMLTIAS